MSSESDQRYSPEGEQDVLNAFRLMLLTNDNKMIYSAMSLLRKILMNVQKHPQKGIYHRVRLSSKPVQDHLMPVPGSIALLRAVGFQDAGDSEHLELHALTKGDCDKLNNAIIVLDCKMNDIVHPFSDAHDPIRDLDVFSGVLRRHHRNEERNKEQIAILAKIEAAKRERYIDQEQKRH
uniref:PUB domain-containing protein n=1 Tax=Spongospora subterranea TaxID=70186 RepID=A0A0H5REB8_9EUKA|eukprot:CRZ12106.1 hypothetical protein [Spongospora subterranea]